MKRYILTGAPGAGKTVLIRLLETRGHVVVEEAATDVIALLSAEGKHEHWKDPAFIDRILALQLLRLERAMAGPVQFHDRSPICTYALCRFLGFPIPPVLDEAITRIERDRVYERRVFFIDNLGFVTPTDARRITYEDTLKFEAVHERVYRQFGYELVRVGRGTLEERAGVIEGCAEALGALKQSAHPREGGDPVLSSLMRASDQLFEVTPSPATKKPGSPPSRG